MPKINVKNLIKNNTVKFSHYRAGYLFYTICELDSEGKPGQNYMFSISIEETSGASFKAEDKAIMFLQFINKNLKNSTFNKI